MLMIWHDSTRIEQLITTNDDPSYQMSVCSVLQINIQYDGSSFIVMSPSIRVESCRFDNIYNPPSQTLAEYFLSVLQIDIQYDGLSFVVTSCSIRVDLCRFNNIFNPLSQTLVEYILSLLQIDFGMPFHVLRDGFSDLHYTTSLSKSTSSLTICQLPLTICSGLGVLDNLLSFSRMCALFTVLSFRICFNFSPFYHSVIPPFQLLELPFFFGNQLLLTISLLDVSVMAIVRESPLNITSNTILSFIHSWTLVLSTFQIYSWEKNRNLGWLRNHTNL